jgi:predicted metalloprotease
MPTKLISTGAALLAAGAIAACGSSSSSSSTTTATTSVATSSAATTSNAAATASTPATATGTATTSSAAIKPAATVHGATVTDHLGGTTGTPATTAVIRQFSGFHRHNQHAHINGLSGLSLTQKMGTLLNSVAGMWKDYFSQSGSQLPAASAVLIANSPGSCGSAQITSSSAPEYCTSNATIELPLGTITSNIAPLGDSALLLLMSDLYGYHVENAIGALQKKYSNAQLEKMDSCFSGVYFYYAESQGYLQPTDETGVNNLLVAEAPAGSSTSAGSVSAAQLAAAFNQGILSNLNPKVCLP